MRSRRLLGHIDGLERTHVAGWAARADGTPVELRIMVDSKHIGSVTPANPRPDLEPIFGGATNHGFHFVFRRPIAEGAIVAVTDPNGRHIGGSPQSVPAPDVSWLTADRRWPLAKHYLKGAGIEIGALHKPLPIGPTIAARYVDHLSRADLYALHPEMASFDIVEPQIVADARTLEPIPDASQDFVIANHVIEHMEDPIAVLVTFVRVLKPDGILYMTVPDKRYTFDRNRPPTTIEHLLRDHETGPHASRRDHYLEYAGLAGGEDLAARAGEFEAKGFDIHFHVWTPLSFASFLETAISRFAIPLDQEVVIRNGDEFIAILRKMAP